MKNLVVVVLILLSSYCLAQDNGHIFNFSLSPFLEQLDMNSADEKDFRIREFGLSLNYNHRMNLSSLRWLGSFAQISYLNKSKMFLTTGLVVRNRVYNIIELECYLPALHVNLNKGQSLRYNNKTGVGINFFKGKLQVNVRTLYTIKHHDINTRLSFMYFL